MGWTVKVELNLSAPCLLAIVVNCGGVMKKTRRNKSNNQHIHNENTTINTAKKYNTTLRNGAYIVSLRRILEAMKVKG